MKTSTLDSGLMDHRLVLLLEACMIRSSNCRCTKIKEVCWRQSRQLNYTKLSYSFKCRDRNHRSSGQEDHPPLETCQVPTAHPRVFILTQFSIRWLNKISWSYRSNIKWTSTPRAVLISNRQIRVVISPSSFSSGSKLLINNVLWRNNSKYRALLVVPLLTKVKVRARYHNSKSKVYFSTFKTWHLSSNKSTSANFWPSNRISEEIRSSVLNSKLVISSW